ncbi:MAG: hypothetical protein B7X10_06695, partial [Burkholderiales bacterium 21-58-4]
MADIGKVRQQLAAKAAAGAKKASPVKKAAPKKAAVKKVAAPKTPVKGTAKKTAATKAPAKVTATKKTKTTTTATKASTGRRGPMATVKSAAEWLEEASEDTGTTRREALEFLMAYEDATPSQQRVLREKCPDGFKPFLTQIFPPEGSNGDGTTPAPATPDGGATMPGVPSTSSATTSATTAPASAGEVVEGDDIVVVNHIPSSATEQLGRNNSGSNLTWIAFGNQSYVFVKVTDRGRKSGRETIYQTPRKYWDVHEAEVPTRIERMHRGSG